MPQINEIEWARDVGYKSKYDKVVWLACNDCGEERWVFHYNLKNLRIKNSSKLCKKCAMRELGDRPKPRGIYAYNWKGGRINDTEGYIKLFLPGYSGAVKGGYIFEHRYIWEQANGELPKGWIVHHLNGIKDDNRLENLRALPDRTHRKMISSLKNRILELETELNHYKARIKELMDE